MSLNAIKIFGYLRLTIGTSAPGKRDNYGLGILALGMLYKNISITLQSTLHVKSQLKKFYFWNYLSNRKYDTYLIQILS